MLTMETFIVVSTINYKVTIYFKGKGSSPTPSGVGEEPQPKSNLVHLALKSDIWWQQF